MTSYESDEEGIVVLSSSDEEEGEVPSWGRGISEVIDLVDSDDEEGEIHKGLWEEGVERPEKEDGKSDKKRREEHLRSYGGHQWCERRAEAEAWLRVFVVDQDEADIPFYEELRDQTYVCLQCLEEYLLAKNEVISFLHNNASYSFNTSYINDVDRGEEFLKNLDLQYVTRVFSQVEVDGAPTDAFSYALYEVLLDHSLLSDETLNLKFVTLMKRLHSYIELEVDKRKLPGCYFLLAHPDSSLRAWAVKLVNQMGTLTLPDYKDFIKPIFASWYQALEETYLGEQQGGGEPRRVKKEYWTALRMLLEKLDTKDGALRALFMDYPSLADMIFHHAEIDSEHVFNADLRQVTAACLRLFLTKMTYEAWSFADANMYNPDTIFDSIIQLVQRTGKEVSEGALKSALDILVPFLKSVESYRGRTSRGQQASYVDRALNALCNYQGIKEPRNRLGLGLQARRYIESAVCRVLMQAYQPGSYSGDWPVASSECWAPLVVSCLRQSNREDSEAIQAITTVLEAHARDAIEAKLVDCLDGIRTEDQQASNKNPDLLCSRLMNVLCREKPVTELAPAVVDALFEVQAKLFLIPTKETKGHPLLLFRQLIRCCALQAEAFSVLLHRIMAANITAHPIQNVISASHLAPRIIPILMTDNTDVRGVVLRLISGDKDATLSFSLALRSLPQDTIVAIWKGAQRVLVVMNKLGYHEFFLQWARLLDLSTKLVEVTASLETAVTDGAEDWWRFIKEVLGQGIKRHLEKRDFDATMVLFFDLFHRLLPSLITVMETAVLRRHSSWLPSLVDWLTYQRLGSFPRIQQKVLSVLQVFMRAIQSRGVPCDDTAWTRLNGLCQSTSSQLNPVFQAELTGYLMNVRASPSPQKPTAPPKREIKMMFRTPPPSFSQPKRRPSDPGKRPAEPSPSSLPATKRPHTLEYKPPPPPPPAPSSKPASSSSPQPLRLNMPNSSLQTLGPQQPSTATRPRIKPPPPSKPSGSSSTAPRPPPPRPPPASAIAGKPRSRQEAKDSSLVSQMRMPSADDFEVFRHLKELTVQNRRHIRDFHRYLLRWLIDDIQASTGTLEADTIFNRKVPTRFRDFEHYVEIFEPLLLEECRCALAKELEDRLDGQGGPQRARPRGSQPPQGDIDLELQRVTHEKDDEEGGLYTLHFSQASFRRGSQAKFGSPSDLFLLRPSVRKKNRSLLEEGEVSDDDDEGSDSKATTLRELVRLAKENELPHCLAVVESDEDIDPTRVGAEDDSESLRMNIYLVPEDDERRPNHLAPHRLRLKTKWIATCIGNITTSLREFSALREVQRVRLAPHIIHGGRDKSAAERNLEVVSPEELMARWVKIEGMVQAAINQPEGPGKKETFDQVQGEIRRMAKVRVSSQILVSSKIGMKMTDLRKSLTDTGVRKTCKGVLDSWKKQIRSERSCYASKSSSEQNTDSFTTGDVRQPGCVPTELWLAVCRSYNAPQLRAIAQACHTLYSSTSVSRGQITLLQGPPGTGKTRTIMGLLSAILSASPHRAPLQPTANSGRGTIRATVRMGGGSTRTNRILVCAPSNGAVDEILLRLLQSKTGGGLLNGKGQPFSPVIVRIGQVGPDAPPEVQEAVLEAQIMARMKNSMEMAAFEAAQEEVDRLIKVVESVWKELSLARRAVSSAADQEASTMMEDQRRSSIRALETHHRSVKLELVKAKKRKWECSRALDAERVKHRTAIIKDAQIVLATLSSSATSYLSDAVTATSYGFGTVVVDEAGQAVEPSTLIPLRYGCRNLILVGDPRQLPATVLSPAVTKLGYDLSLFERLEQGGHPVHMLTVQYRMHPDIRSFPSQQFYQGKLADAKFLREGSSASAPSSTTNSSQPPVIMPYHAAPYFKPYLVFDVCHGREQMVGTSIINLIEAQFAVSIFKRLQLEYGELVGAERVAIITPYKRQVRTLQDECKRVLGQGYARLVELNTVDGFQGREKDIIIFSCVRSDRRVGFLTDKRRMNVALTRARRALFVLGHVQTLMRDPTWRALVEDARSRGVLVDTQGQSFDEVCSRLIKGLGATEKATLDRHTMERAKLPPPPPQEPTRGTGDSGIKRPPPPPPPVRNQQGPPHLGHKPPPPPPPQPQQQPSAVGGGGGSARKATDAAQTAPANKPPVQPQGVDLLLSKLTSSKSSYVEETAPLLRPGQLKSKLPAAHAALLPPPNPAAQARSHPPPPASEIYERPTKRTKGSDTTFSSSQSFSSSSHFVGSGKQPMNTSRTPSQPPPPASRQPSSDRSRHDSRRDDDKKGPSGNRSSGSYALSKAPQDTSSNRSTTHTSSNNRPMYKSSGSSSSSSTGGGGGSSSSLPVLSGGGGIGQRLGSSVNIGGPSSKKAGTSQADRLKKVTGQGASFNLLSFMGGGPPQKKK